MVLVLGAVAAIAAAGYGAYSGERAASAQRAGLRRQQNAQVTAEADLLRQRREEEQERARRRRDEAIDPLALLGDLPEQKPSPLFDSPLLGGKGRLGG